MSETTTNHVPACCVGVTCHICGQAPAAHKVEEVIFDDDPQPIRHPLTAYACRACFDGIMRPRSAGGAPGPRAAAPTAPTTDADAVFCEWLAGQMEDGDAFNVPGERQANADHLREIKRRLLAGRAPAPTEEPLTGLERVGLDALESCIEWAADRDNTHIPGMTLKEARAVLALIQRLRAGRAPAAATEPTTAYTVSRGAVLHAASAYSFHPNAALWDTFIAELNAHERLLRGAPPAAPATTDEAAIRAYLAEPAVAAEIDRLLAGPDRASLQAFAAAALVEGRRAERAAPAAPATTRGVCLRCGGTLEVWPEAGACLSPGYEWVRCAT